MQRVYPSQNGQFGSKIKNPKNMLKTMLQDHRKCCVQKTVRKNIKYSINETILKIGHLTKAIAHAKAIAFAKWSVWVKNYKCQKHVKNYSTRTLELLSAKNRSKKHQIFNKWDDFENRPSYKGYNPCKGYSLRKMVSLGQKLKILKTC